MTRLEGAPNFRDLGGIPTTDGRVLRRGRLFRSDVLSRLTEDDLIRLAELDIRVVCDLRSPKERMKESNRWPETQSVRTIVPKIESNITGVKPTHWTRRFLDPEFNASRAYDAMVDSYRRMPQAFAEQLAALFAHLDTPHGGAVLIHCVAGKDRTGFVCAMVLSALGVPPTEIYRDYLLSAERFALTGRVEMVLRDLFGGEIPHQTLEAAAIVGGVSTSFLQTAFDEIERNFGSVDRYLETMTGLNAERKCSLRQRLLAERLAATHP